MFSGGVVFAMIYKRDTVCSIWFLKVVPFCNVKSTEGFFPVKYIKGSGVSFLSSIQKG